MLVTYLPDIGASPAGHKGIFVAFSKYEERDLPKSAGWRWDPSTRRWFTSDPERARRLVAYADEAARAALSLRSAEAEAAIEASLASLATIDVPAPEGLSYLPYQRAGIAYALSRDRVLIGDEMGLGKTIQAIGIANATRPKRTLIICPASLRINWQREWSRWCVEKVRAVIVTDTWPLALRGDDLLAEPVAAILSYQGARKWKHQLDLQVFDLLILDEVHALKDPKTKQTRAIFGFQRKSSALHQAPIKAKRIVALTGTPIVNRPEGLWPIVHALDPGGLGGSRQDYWIRYVGEPMPPANLGWKEAADYVKRTKDHRMRELHDRLRAGIMVRRLKSEVLTELPAKRRQVILLDPTGMGDALAAERSMLAEKAQQLLELTRSGGEGEHRAAVQRLTAWRGAALAEISRIRHQTAVKKLPAAIEHIWSVLDEADKAVIFCHHHDVIDGMAEAFGDIAVVLDGRKSDAERDNAVRAFQSDRKVRLFLGSIRAAGLGLTLTAASVVCFAELDWTPAAMVQAEDRLHRIGQRNAVLVQHLVVDGSIDQRMATLLIQKAEIIDKILDGKAPPEMSQSVLDGVLKNYSGQSSANRA